MGNPELILGDVNLYQLKNLVQSTPEEVEQLFKLLNKDFYGRMDFSEIQATILADRTIRLNYIVSQILNIPVKKVNQKSRFKAKLVSSRKIPLNLKNKKLKKNPGLPMEKPMDWLFKKKKLNQAEEFMLKEKTNTSSPKLKTSRDS